MERKEEGRKVYGALRMSRLVLGGARRKVWLDMRAQRVTNFAEHWERFCGRSMGVRRVSVVRGTGAGES